MAENSKKEAKKVKLPTAKKRDLQNEKRRARNKAFKSRIRTAIRALVDSKDKNEETTPHLNKIYSLMDKGVKKGIVKQNKANRFKSRLTKKVSA
jgi:small subunit ribosomal protein S20